ncbi:MAG: hypothetical protein C5B51_03040 [Terriglobia bacterium]|nr:MAG: hypothetical protein C5B51_03040 [Terriglobia bacterium]
MKKGGTMESFHKKMLRTCLLAVTASAILAQTSTGIIVGRVTDQTGSVLSSANVQLVNTGTGLSHRVQTNSEGFFRSPDLPPGSYDITVEETGFKTAVIRGVVLQINQTARVDVTAELGAVSQQVEVEAAAPLLQTETSATGQVIADQSIVNLPLNGRNYLDLTKLVPGVTQAQGGRGAEVNQKVGSAWAIIIGGQRIENQEYLLEGTTARNYFVGTGNLLPSIDSIQEFKVQENSFSAEFGFGVAIVNAALRSGTNNFHGSAFEFLRNNDLDATNFFTNTAKLPKDLLRRNQFGGSLGGPIKKNKAFFFGNYEGTREHRGHTLLGLVPTAAQRAGDFSGAGNPAVVVDPYSAAKAPFPNNQIPLSRFSPFALATLQYYPASNASLAGANFVRAPNDRSTADQFGLKGDVTLSQKDTLSTHFLFGDNFNTALDVIPLGGQTYPVQTRNAGISEIHTFSPTLVNEVRLGYNYGNVFASQEITPTNVAETQFGFRNLPQSPLYWGLPKITIAGLSPLGNANGGNRPESGKNNIYQAVDNLTWIHGRQTIKTGLDIRHMIYKGQTSVPRGGADFNGQFSKSSVADLLLGAADTANGTQGDPIGYQVSTSFGAFVQDDIRLLPNLTLNLGLRWEYYQPPMDVNGQGRQTYFDLFNTGNFLLVNQHQWPAGIFQPDYDNFGPRIGLAWRVKPKTVVRAALGMFYNGMLQQGNETVFIHNIIPFRFSTSLTANPTVPNINLATDLLPPIPSFSAVCCPKQNPQPNLSVFMFDYHGITPYMEQWNFSIQREVIPNLMIDVAYVGNHGVHLYGRVPPNFAVGDKDLANPTPVQSRRPYAWIGSVTMSAPAMSSWYNSLQIKAEKRLSHGLLLLASYTFAKYLDMQDSTAGGEGNMIDGYNWALNKGLSANDVRNRLVISGLWEIPVGRGRPFGSDFGKVADTIAGGWRVNFITTFQTGYPVDIRSNISNNRGGGNNKPNQLCAANLARSERTISRYFNTSCFVPQAFGAIGNAGRDTVTGPGIVNWDLSVFKNFKLLSENRMNLEFRSEFFNAWNHTQFIGPDTWTIPSANFGVITTAAAPRVIQFGSRLTF